MPRLCIRRLLLTAPGRNYSVEFQPGVNIICGPISTGKSSVLQLIDYALGRRTPPKYPEIAKCSDVLLETTIDDETLTIRRSLKASGEKAQIFDVAIDEVLASARNGREVSPKHKADEESISLEVLDRLGFGLLKVKTAPTQEASGTASFSVRDLLRLVFVDQDRIASASAFLENQPFNRIKWEAAFEIVHKIHDSAATELGEQLATAQQRFSKLQDYLESAQRFLDEAEVPTLPKLQISLEKLLTEKASLASEHAQRQAGAEVLLGEDLVLVKRARALATERETLVARAAELDRTLDNLGRLRVQYEREQEQLHFLKESKKQISSLPLLSCPACFQNLPKAELTDGTCHVCHLELPESDDAVSVEARLTSLKRRIRDLDKYIAELTANRQGIQLRLAASATELRDNQKSLGRIRQGNLFAETQAIADIKEAQATNSARRRATRKNMRLRARALGDGSKLKLLQDSIRELEQQVAKTGADSASKDDVLSSLGEHLRTLLSQVHFPHESGISVSVSNYRPIVRNQPYSDLSSKGAIALTVTCWHLALLTYALDEGSRHPCLLMLDSPLSHVGKNSDDPEFRDQKIVDAFYKLMAELHDHAADRSQVIVIDNSPPESASPLYKICFTGDPDEGRYGLIDDEYPPPV